MSIGISSEVEAIFKTMREDFELCPRCRCCEMVWEDCDTCDEGYSAPGELHDLDPLWYDEDDVQPCDWCQAKGGWRVCGGRCDEDGQHVKEAAHA